MKNKEMIKKLQKLDPEAEVLIDMDQIGFYTVEKVEENSGHEDLDLDGTFINIKSSNDS